MRLGRLVVQPTTTPFEFLVSARIAGVRRRLGSDNLRRVTVLALPIIGGMVSQNLLNLIDMAMIGSLGDSAIAGVGLASFSHFMAISFVMGMGSGVQALAARAKGAGDLAHTAVALNGGLLLSLLITLPATVVLLATLDVWFSFLTHDASVAAAGSAYMSIRLWALAAVGMNFAFRGYWNAIDLSRFYMGTLAIMHAVNILLNWMLIYGNWGAPALGVRGAALGTAISVWLGTSMYFWLGWRHARKAGFLTGVPSWERISTMIRVAAPAGFQQFSFATGMTLLFYIIGEIGTAELAAANVLIHVMLVTVLPSIGFGLAAATLVGQALGAGDQAEAMAWGWRVSRMAATVVALVSLPAFIFPDAILGVFLHDPATALLARTPLRIVAFVSAFDAVGAVLMNAELGAGNSGRILKISLLTQWGFFLPLAWFVGSAMGFGLLGVWIVNGIYRLITTATYTLSWRSGGWSRVRL